jgi:hypothetical protein
MALCVMSARALKGRYWRQADIWSPAIDPHSRPDQFRNAKLRRCSLVRYAAALTRSKGRGCRLPMVVASTL